MLVSGAETVAEALASSIARYRFKLVLLQRARGGRAARVGCCWGGAGSRVARAVLLFAAAFALLGVVFVASAAASGASFVQAFGTDVNSSNGSDVCTTASGCKQGTYGGGAGEFEDPVGDAVAGSGDVYVADYVNERIDEFTQSGIFVRAFGQDVGGTGIDVCTTSCQQGSFGEAAGELDDPEGVAVAGSGDVYVADFSNNRIDEFTGSGTFVQAFGQDVGGTGVDVCTTSCQAGTAAGAAGAMDDPIDVAVSGSSDVYVADVSNQRIDEFTQSGSFVRAFGRQVNESNASDICTTTSGCQQGTTGAGPGEFDGPKGVAVAGSGNVYVGDSNNQRIDEFTGSASFVQAFGLNVGGTGVDVCTTTCQAGLYSDGAGGLQNPGFVAVQGSSDVYVGGQERINDFTQSGSFVQAFGQGVNSSDGSDVCTTTSGCQTATMGAGAGAFNQPEGIAVLAGSGDVYIADYYNQRIDVWGGLATGTPTPTPTPTPGPSPPSCTLSAQGKRVFAEVIAAASKKHGRKHQKGVLKLTTDCNQSATLTLTGKIRAVLKKKPVGSANEGKHKRSKTKTFQIAVVSAAASAGKPLTLTVKLPKSALAALKKGAHESAVFTLTATNANGSSHTSTTIKRLKLAKSKPKKP